eukprot:XP_014778503.1 PREDICTED: olfactomedin-like protein 2A [Octopus bimaculoides]
MKEPESRDLKADAESVQILPPTTTVRPTPPLPPRPRECAIKVFGKPVHQRYTNHSWGAWMRDATLHRQRYWYTPEYYGNLIYEYKDRNHYKNNIADHIYDMGEHHYQGVGHLIYRRSFYFHLAHTSKVARYSLAEQKVVSSSKNMPKAISTGERSLYSFQYNYFDFAVDENGIWVLYGKNSSEETLIVVKLDGDTLQILKKWELPIKHRSYGNAFIVCGVLYLVQSVSKPKTKVEIVYDLYADVKLCKVLGFSNPFGHNYMIAFYHKKIYGYDNGNEITYPVLMYDRKELETLMKSC